MSTDAVFAVKIPLSELRSRIGDTDLRLRGLGDATLVYTGVSLRGSEPAELGRLARQLLGDALSGYQHELLVFPDAVKPEAASWAELVEELDGLAEPVPLDAPEAADAAANDLSQAMGQVMAALGPQLGELTQALMSGQPDALEQSQRRIEQLLAQPEGAALRQVLGQLDLGAVQRQAEELLGQHTGADDDDDER